MSESCFTWRDVFWVTHLLQMAGILLSLRLTSTSCVYIFPLYVYILGMDPEHGQEEATGCHPLPLHSGLGDGSHLWLYLNNAVINATAQDFRSPMTAAAIAEGYEGLSNHMTTSSHEPKPTTQSAVCICRTKQAKDTSRMI